MANEGAVLTLIVGDTLGGSYITHLYVLFL